MTSSDDKSPAEEVMVECELDAAPEKVWRALTVPGLAAEWLGTSPAGGSNYQLIEAEPFSRVRYAWHDPETEPVDSLLTFEIAPRGDKTFFRITHAISSTAGAPSAANNNGPPQAVAA